ncbi:uncharacterized protein N7459_007989 [Penicillium hispanicum]|uniref:uncharacterized protein n=1 Tax=Penicillium hispanicum TaxID=1080232 RepID=UPI0025414FE2|nr:uncharacterized protein N7459_007989 [Penicillium hispanicum]KAJ5573562.1 hypothetical protein N7459_007989 [Penicillium hispanicum]
MAAVKEDTIAYPTIAEPVYGEPPAWADSRPGLADALPWFRAVQGGMYHCKGFCWGFLLDADCGDRAYISDEVVITRMGGGCTKDGQGNLILIKNQDMESAPAKSLLQSQMRKVPIGLIIGSMNTVLNRELPHRFNIMDWFHITDVWYEKTGKQAGIKVRFEKLDLSSKSWWATKNSPDLLPLVQRDFDTKPESIECPSCGQESRRVYNEGWMCLQPQCTQFWKIDDKCPDELTFHPVFLNYRNAPDPTMQPHYSLVPDLLSNIKDEDTDITSSRIAWRGIVCPECSKCIPRVFWRGWKCNSDLKPGTEKYAAACKFEKMLPMHPVSLMSVLDDFELGPIKRAILLESGPYSPEIDDVSLAPFRKITYTLPGVGTVTHFVSNRKINGRAGGPNDLFMALQERDIGLRRYCLQQSVVAETLTSHFAVNYGMPYKYVVAVDSKGFNEAPPEILSALGRLSWATQQAASGTGHEYLPPNELLAIGYFEDMKMGYHDDGEFSLGPTIATFSLGGRAIMTIRMKYKYYHGYTRAKKYLEDDPVLPGCKFESERRELKAAFKNGTITEKVYHERRADLLKMGDTKGGEAPPIIKLGVHHGDFVVMHGENLQKYYEHMVVPEDKMRFALTARYIKPEHVSPEDLEKGKFSLTPDQIYDGQ